MCGFNILMASSCINTSVRWAKCVYHKSVLWKYSLLLKPNEGGCFSITLSLINSDNIYKLGAQTVSYHSNCIHHWRMLLWLNFSRIQTLRWSELRPPWFNYSSKQQAVLMSLGTHSVDWDGLPSPYPVFATVSGHTIAVLHKACRLGRPCIESNANNTRRRWICGTITAIKPL